MAQTSDSTEKKIADPLGKPEIWEALKAHPDDSLMWTRYISKPFACFNKKDRDNISKWKGFLSKALDEVVIEGQSDHVDWAEEASVNEEANKAVKKEQERVESEINSYITRLEQTLVEEKQMIKELKNNLTMNFFIIEELYQEEFEELGITYQSYASAYPNGEYNKQQWIEEKEKQLYKLKSKNFQKVKKQILRDARKHRIGNVD